MMIKKIRNFVYKLFSLDLVDESEKYFNESRRYRDKAVKHKEHIEQMLTLNGEEKWMLNVCKVNKNNEKECFPDTDKDK